MSSDIAIAEVIISRSGDAAVYADILHAIVEVFDRDAIALNLGIRIQGRSAPRSVTVLLSDTFLEELDPTALALPDLAKNDLMLACALARLGDFLDKSGVTPALAEGDALFSLRCDQSDLRAWLERAPAHEADVSRYVAAKVEWASRFDSEFASAHASDSIRLKLPWTTIDSMARRGDGIFWQREPGSMNFAPLV